VDITVSRNLTSEAASQKSFSALQDRILSLYGTSSPSAPVLRCRNATQTSVVLEWDAIDLKSAQIRSLSLFRNGSKVGTIPKPLDLTTTKISGLAIDTPYTFQLVLRTSAGTFSSAPLNVRTHALTNLSGITVTPGMMPAAIKSSLLETLERIGARVADSVRIDTTHFVCTEARGAGWERAREMNIPVVVPDWVVGCEREGRIVGVRQYYLDADPRLRQMGPSVAQQQQQQHQQDRPQTPTLATPTTKITPPTPEQSRPPEVPPKDTPRESADDTQSVQSTLVEQPKEEKESEQKEERDEEKADDSDGTERDVARSPEVSSKGKKATVEDEKDDAGFDDVAL
jgi:chitin biosynthesis protein CHS5